jgi:ABC-type transport system involved in multi-copper enzyme maturation permease subunit
MPTPIVRPATQLSQWTNLLLTIGGAAALIGFAIPFAADVVRLRARRIGALARLSFKEAVRRRVVWAPVVILLIFLFPPKWFFLIKPEKEISTYVSVIYWFMTPIMLLIASLLAAFAIPTDMRNQTIHTVVTKPVERFEIVLGRVFGYVGLVTVILAGLSLISVLLLWASDPSEEARFESYKARVPVYGKLEFLNIRTPTQEFDPVKVGREWEYRSYIAGASPHRAIWKFTNERDLRAMADRKDSVPCEFEFDIFRTTKGDENKGVTCSFQFVAWPWGNPERSDARQEQAYQDATRGLKAHIQPGDPGWDAADSDWAKLDRVAEQFGYYEYRSKEIADYHTFNINVPPGLIRAALKDRPAGSNNQALLVVIVRCESPTQFLGVAKRDLYFLAGDEPFFANFFKGVFGLWLRLVLVISIAVACSTYLSGVIAWLVVGFFYFAGMFQDFIAMEAAGVSAGGGPFESAIRLSQNANLITPLPDSAGKSLALTGDAAYQWGLRKFLLILPDVDRFSWSNYVASGFSVPWAVIGLNCLYLVLYLYFWAVLANYLMKAREVANPS